MYVLLEQAWILSRKGHRSAFSLLAFSDSEMLWQEAFGGAVWCYQDRDLIPRIPLHESRLSQYPVHGRGRDAAACMLQLWTREV